MYLKKYFFIVLFFVFNSLLFSNLITTSESINVETELIELKNLIKSFGTDKLIAHKKLFDIVKSDKNKRDLLSKYIEDIDKEVGIPSDYQFFLKQVLTNFRSQEETQNINDGILLNLSKENYAAKLLLSIDGFYSLSDKNYIRKLVVTGTYTSPLGWPTGLALSNGNVINPALQKWDGLVLFDENGKVSIEKIDNLSETFNKKDIRNNITDYMSFVEFINQRKISLIQSHLLIYNGNVLVSTPQNNQKDRRRAICLDANENLIICDTMTEKLTLIEFAYRLKNTHNIKKAVNLDMGTFDYCRFHYNGEFYDIGVLNTTEQLSNLIEIKY